MTVIQVPTLDFLNEKLGQYMAMYNDTVRGGHLDLVFFKDAMTHLVKVSTFLLFFEMGDGFTIVLFVNVQIRQHLKSRAQSSSDMWDVQPALAILFITTHSRLQGSSRAKYKGHG